VRTPALTQVVGAILRRDGKVLLCLRSRDRANYPGVWDIPGGHVEATETIPHALVRELHEELGIQACLQSSNPWTVQRAGRIELSVFVIERWTGEPSNRAPEEHEDIRWFAIEELAGLRLAHPSFEKLLMQALLELSSNC